jgi:hypothetical protein
VKQSKLPSQEIEKLVSLMSQSIFQLSLQSVNLSGTVGTIVGASDALIGKNLDTGSSPDKKPTAFKELVAKEIEKTVPNLTSVKIETNATVICKTANGTTQVMPQGTVCN